MTCLDCGATCPDTLDHPLCDECAALAFLLVGSIARRVEQLGDLT